MKSLSKFALSATLGACGLLGLSSSAFALTTENGSICKAYGSTTTPGIYSYVNGTYNYSGNFTSLLCPVVRTIPAPSGGYSVWVDGTTGTAGGGYCYLYSYDYDATYKGSVGTGPLPVGKFDRLLTLTAAQVPFYSSQSVYCYLPNGGGVFDVEPVQ
jgi:hypothetical protein